VNSTELAADGYGGLGAWVRQWRHTHRQTQEGLAEALGYDVSYIAKIERGRRRPTAQFVARLATVTATPTEEILRLARRPSSRTRLPVPPGPLVGRGREVAEVSGLLKGHARIVSILGAPGIGKTSLALEVAWRLAEEFRHGACFVPLAEISDSRSVAFAIVHQMGLVENGRADLDTLLVETVRHRNLLLVLDNFEHVLAGRELVQHLVAGAPDLRVLVTSREALRLDFEAEYRLSTLPFPDPAAPSVRDVEEYPAVKVFVAASRVVRPTFTLNDRNARSVVEICSQLDGLPLALTLAAAASRLLSPSDIARSLRVRLELPTNGHHDGLAHGRLGSALDWSWDLLQPAHRRLLARLGVFVGGCTLEAAEAVCWGTCDDVLAGLAALEGKSLIGATSTPDGESRFVCLEVVRRYALDRLQAEGSLDEVRDRHCSYFVDLVTRAEAQIVGGEDQAWWLRRLEADYANITTAFEWALARDPAKALRMGAALWRFYSMGHVSEGRRLIGAAAERGVGCALDHLRVLNGLGVLARCQGDLDDAACAFSRARTMATTLGATAELALAILNQGIVAEAKGCYEEARSCFHEAMDLSAGIGDGRGVGHALNCLGVVSLRLDDRAAASGQFLSAIARFRALDDSCSVAITATNLGWIAETDGDLAEARQWYEETLQILEDAGDEHGRARAMADLGRLARRQRDFSHARPLLEGALAALHRHGDRRLAAACLLELADICLERHRHDLAGRLVGAAEAVREALGTPAWPEERALEEQVLAGLCDAVGVVAAARAREIGRALALEDAVEMVQSDVWPPPVLRRRAGRHAVAPSPGWPVASESLARAAGATTASA
jgi:predicted ATPase/Flp pilus assembly protein TadD/DNA-binding XRE family transcriptional regulator